MGKLKSLGVVDIAGQNTEKRAPFAGRLRLFNTNWHIITKDQWVIQASYDLENIYNWGETGLYFKLIPHSTYTA